MADPVATEDRLERGRTRGPRALGAPPQERPSVARVPSAAKTASTDEVGFASRGRRAESLAGRERSVLPGQELRSCWATQARRVGADSGGRPPLSSSVPVSSHAVMVFHPISGALVVLVLGSRPPNQGNWACAPVLGTPTRPFGPRLRPVPGSAPRNGAACQLAAIGGRPRPARVAAAAKAGKTGGEPWPGRSRRRTHASAHSRGSADDRGGPAG